MLEYVKQCVSLSDCHLTAEERSLLSVVYKNITGNLRNSWRIVHHLSTQRSSAGALFQREAALLKRQQSKIEQELVSVCQDVLKLLESRLLPVALAGEEAVFYHKMYVTCQVFSLSNHNRFLFPFRRIFDVFTRLTPLLLTPL